MQWLRCFDVSAKALYVRNRLMGYPSQALSLMAATTAAIFDIQPVLDIEGNAVLPNPNSLLDEGLAV